MRAALTIVGQVRQVGVRAALAIVRLVGQVRQVGGLRRLRRLGGLGGLGGMKKMGVFVSCCTFFWYSH